MPAADEKFEFAAPDGRGPVVVRRPAAQLQAHTWLTENRSRIDDIVATHGGVLLRDFGFTSVSAFNRAVQIFSPDLLDYVHRSTPRTKIGGKIYSATEYPADRSIPLHNENSYTDAWPDRIYFFCLVAAEHGGETPIADSRGVYRRIDPAVRERFERAGVLYVRNFNEGVDLSWQEVFQTEDRTEVERYCAAHRIEFEWRDRGPALRTSQRCQATVPHPGTGEPVWFNQAHLFHISALDAGEQASLIETFGTENVPRNAFYGDGSPIEPDVLEHIRDAYEQEKALFIWQRGDIMVLDNLLFAHGRRPFKGARKIVVAMS
ncbi:TauD/TfdA family dioxygenase [Micromonospora sp. WMMA1363]|uniref:TauD/TfdA family dioxygenase n=1 Tax=Micromonospora sp. WMMA1363 TaxID=3053985 RepID=UPI00259C6F0B|nr:TauD/TfdA family dioxygenase [Micromonospora sp. WMMA1363]MDM4719715.1 TauD/TfdA family dioxygenase [Micromonospora sp. WMMA1363]